MVTYITPDEPILQFITDEQSAVNIIRILKAKHPNLEDVHVSWTIWNMLRHSVFYQFNGDIVDVVIEGIRIL